MSDPAPEGFVSLSIAFKRYCRLQPPTDNVHHYLAPFIEFLRNGTLSTIVREPTHGEKFSIPPEVWGQAWYPERPILTDKVLGNEASGLEPYRDRTIFVDESALSKLLRGPISRKPRCKRYPWNECGAEFIRKLVEDGVPTVDGGEKGWRLQADAERWVANWMFHRLGPDGTQPSPAINRRYVSKWLHEFKASLTEFA